MNSADELWSLFRVIDRKQFDDVPQSAVQWFYDLLTETDHSNWLIWKDGMPSWMPLADLHDIIGPKKAIDAAPKPPPVPQDLEATVSQVRKPNAKTGGAAKSGGAAKAGGAAASAAAQPNAEPKLQIQQTDQLLNDPLQTNDPVSGVTPSQLLPVNHRVIAVAPDEAATLSLMLDSKGSSDGRNMVRYQKRLRVKIPLPGGGVFDTVTVDASLSGLRLRDPIPSGLPRFFAVELDCGVDGKIPLMCSAIKERDGKVQHRLRIQVNDFQNKLKAALMRAA